MIPRDIRLSITECLSNCIGNDFKKASIELLNCIGYRSEKTLDLDNSPRSFLAEFDRRERKLNQTKSQFVSWKSIDFLFQITDDEVRESGGQRALDFQSGFKFQNYQSYLFFALDLMAGQYTRSQLSAITREINLLFDMPVMLLIRNNMNLTFAVIDRRLHKRDESRNVLEKVKLIKDIHYQKPHRAHIEILHDLALPILIAKHECKDFKQLHDAWRTTLDTNELNKKFYRELADWYFWTLDHVEFPADVEKDQATRNATNVIRLLTRLIFCWFLKEKGLIPDELFSERKLSTVLKSLKADDSTFYLAILQNLFFATLNQRMNTDGLKNRRFTNDGSFYERKDEYGVKNLYRYQKLFAVVEEEALKLFSDIPFLNGGLFDCLDKENNSGKVIYVDGFTRNAKKQPKIPNFLFFSEYRILDLSEAYGDKRRKKEKVRGLINLLDSYKFTVTENTPIEEEIALDPELLGKVFENLLASYNPETGITARKQTGSFYTPRTIVNYMVDESLIAYLEGQLKAKVPKHVEKKDLQDNLHEVLAYTDEVHPFNEEEVYALIDAIDSCKILDPACGSGAFPMGILHKLVFILGKLDPNNKLWKEKQITKAEQIPDVSAREIAVTAIEKDFETNDLDYSRKLYLIENCIHGVDILPIAIQISKLRFFISLICDQRTNDNNEQNRGVRPLPNLETKFVAANTLISLEKRDGLLVDYRLKKLENKLEAVRHKHFAAQRRRDKLYLQKRDAELREEIASILASGGLSGETSHQLAAWDPYNQNTSAPFFDSEWMFGLPQGFDIIVGNPPYLEFKRLSQVFKSTYAHRFETAKGKYDVYILFIERAHQLMKPGGSLVYIIPTMFLKKDYGKAARNFIARTFTPVCILDFADIQMFEGVTNYTGVFHFKVIPCSSTSTLRYHKYKQANDTVAATSSETLAETLGYEEENPLKIILDIPCSSLCGDPWDFHSEEIDGLLRKIEAGKLTLKDITVAIFQGIASGKDEVFYVDDMIINAYSLEKDLLYPLLKGKDVKRYCATWSGTFVIYPYDSDSHALPEARLQSEYPNTYAYFKKMRPKLKGRNYFDNSHKFWYELWNQRKKVNFQKKRIITPEISDRNNFVVIDSYYGNTKTYHILPSSTAPEDYSVLMALLNSRLIEFYYHAIAARHAGGFYAYKTKFLERIPVRDVSYAIRKHLHELTQEIIRIKQKESCATTSAQEAEINQLIYDLYSLTEEEITIVESQNG